MEQGRGIISYLLASTTITSYKLQEVATPGKLRQETHGCTSRITEAHIRRPFQTHFTRCIGRTDEFHPSFQCTDAVYTTEPRPVLTLNDTVNCLQNFS